MRYLAIVTLIFISQLYSEGRGVCFSNAHNSPAVNFDNEPLKDWQAFVVSPIYSLPGEKNIKTRERVASLAKQKLGSIGQVIEMEVNDLTGLGQAATILNFEVQPIETFEASKTNLIQLSLTLQTRISIKKTQKECSAYIWVATAFVEGRDQEDGEEDIVSAAEKVLEEFVMCYQTSNPATAVKPTFYFY